MRVVLDTNVLISALITPTGAADRVYRAWRAGDFDLASCEHQIAEMRRVTRRPAMRDLIKPAEAGRLVNLVRHLAIMIDSLPDVDASPDPWDNFLLATALGARADYLVTGNKGGLLALARLGRTRIVTVRQFLRQLT
jgi:putative PIN family toxin of toxin-antitoxin system